MPFGRTGLGMRVCGNGAYQGLQRRSGCSDTIVGWALSVLLHLTEPVALRCRHRDGRTGMKLSANVLSIVFIAVFGVFLSSQATSAAVTKVVSRASLGANDFIDWSQLGEAVNFVRSGSSVTSSLGLTGSIFNPSYSTNPDYGFRRVDQGSGGWNGNFKGEDALLFSNYKSGPIVIDFNNPVFGAGAQIQSHFGIGSPTGVGFTAYLKVYGADDTTLLATYSESGVSNNYADDTAVFLGALDTTAEIGKIEYYISQTGSGDQSLAISFLSVKDTTNSLSLTKSGTGSGTVTSSPFGISCGANCNASYASGAAVSLAARADAGSYFAGWSAPCSGISTCTLALTADTQVTAAFSPGYFDTVQAVYIGYYQRPADPGGLLYWAERLDATNGNLNEIIEAYANSPESVALYGNIDSSNVGSVVDSIYVALFNRPAEAEGKAFYVDGFNAGRFTAATIMLNVLYGAQNEDLQSINNKLAAANLFTRIIDPEFDGRDFTVTYAGNSDAIAARTFLASVTDDPTTVPTQDEATEYMMEYIADPGILLISM
jgi:hypothetical protein